MPTVADETEYALLVLPEALVRVSRQESQYGLYLRLFGNRVGLASLSSILLWLKANAYRREFLSLTELSFIRSETSLSLSVRVSEGEVSTNLGELRILDGISEVEWEMTEDDLQRIALRLHYLASVPEHEYEVLDVGPSREGQVELRLSDAAVYL
jgi:hypothetical protein